MNLHADAIAIATAVRAGELSAKSVVAAALEQIAAQDKALNCFTTVTAEAALARAVEIDQMIAAGQDPGPLAGVPFAVKNLLDVAGLTTLAGAKIEAEKPAATQDATTVRALKQAGAVLVGALNMDEYAYGFTTENAHYGPCHNPHDLARVAGGSSGGSAAAVAGGLVPLTLGSDTNGSIRVPAALCGIFGLKPTYGRVSRAGAFLFAASLDHIGPFARSVRDIAVAFDILHGPDPADPVCSTRPPEPCLPQLAQGPQLEDIKGLRIAVADGHFAKGGQPEAFAAVAQVAQALGVQKQVTLPESHRARAAAYVITACEGANLHFANLRKRPGDFDPATRDRFLAGTMIPAPWYIQAQRFRRWYQAQVRQIFESVDVILAPTTPCSAPLIGQEKIVLDGEEVLARPNLGLYTQPISFIGLPVLSVPIHRPGALPLGVQLIAAPYNEALLLRVAAVLEAAGVISAPITSSSGHKMIDGMG
ncbi:AtzE family amidohydrolase [Leptolyngbya sp. FACHB-261]|uniref:AtzE family amidohydrolase n=1 Tax=Leptolyngbya sp. FACHB-261 TaxID=2692806 RepID=UPI001687A5E7|nr:AtzE family amidohydrolase [Leptolyngbya sp. FACHB-261]MBD2101404.1 AtzE family amidohydrolase [Leptolyngbya sp. FACHB-261]